MSEGEGSVTLYRIGPLPSEAAAIRQEALASGKVPEWIHDAQEASGATAASGRWFTSDRNAVDWYRREHPEFEVRSVTVSTTDAAGWKAEDHPGARRFASNPEHEYFLPAAIADRALRITAEREKEKGMEQSGAAVVPIKPGTAAAFKQRREAYALMNGLAHDVDSAQSMVHLGLGKMALGTIAPTIDAVEKNPAAIGLIERHKPDLLSQAKAIRSEAAAMAKTEVTTLSTSRWQSDMDGLNETRLSIGQSDKGFHYLLEASHRGGDSTGSWSEALPTKEKAQEAGLEAEIRWHMPALSEKRGEEALDRASASSTAANEAAATATGGTDASTGATTSKGDSEVSTTDTKATTDPKAKHAAAVKRADDFVKRRIAEVDAKRPAAGQNEKTEAAAQEAADKKRAGIRASA